ncbi:MAG: response regulator [Synergistaceae bacterium]|nr:response regulator [Synergistaceae bacterium]
MHDIGERVVAPNGRPAITSVCYDITRERGQRNLLTRMASDMGGGIALYRMKDNWKAELIHATDNLGRLAGYSDEEYMRLCGGDAIYSVYATDRLIVLNETKKVLNEDVVSSVNFRVMDKSGGYTWVNGTFFKWDAEDDGFPVLGVVYLPVPIQYELQMKSLDAESIAVYAIDRETEELYYANDTCFKMHGVPITDFTGRKCHEVFYGKNELCEHCWRVIGKDPARNAYIHVDNKSGSVFSFETQERRWNNRDVVIIYGRDITEQYSLQNRRDELLDSIPCGLSQMRLTENGLESVAHNNALSEILGTDFQQPAAPDSPEALWGYVHPDDLPGLLRSVEENLKQAGKNYDHRYRVWHKGKNAYIWVEIHANVVKQNGETFAYVVYSDITNSSRVQERLENNQRAMSVVLRYGSLGIWSYDLDTRELFQEYSDYGAYGYETSAKNIPDTYIEAKVIHPDDAEIYRNCYRRILDGEGQSDCIVRVYDRISDKYLWMRICLVRQKDLFNGRRRAVGFSVVVDKEVNSIRELENTRAKLEQSQETIEAACAFADMWVFTFDTEKKIVYTGKKLQREFGFREKSENFPENLFAHHFVLPEYEELFREQIRLLCEGTPEVVFDIQSRISNGETHWIRFKGQLSDVWTDRKMATVSAQIVDTEKTMAARLELERKRQQRSVKNLLFFYIANVTQNKIVEYKSFDSEKVNPENMPMDIFVKKGYSRLSYESDRKKAERVYDRERLLASYQSGVTREEYMAQMPLGDGRICAVKHVLQLLKDPAANDIILYDYAYDAGREEITKALLNMESARGYEAVGFLFVMGEQFTIWNFNRDPERPEVETLPFREYMRSYAEKEVHPDDRERFLSHYLDYDYERGPLLQHREIVYRNIKDGGIQYCKGTLYMYEEEKDKRFCVLSRRDYTEIVRSEELEKERLAAALKKAERADRAKTDFLARMSHDMRTPMNAILGMTSLAEDELKDVPAATEYLSRIGQSARYLSGIINDILEMSRIDSGMSKLNPDWHTPADILTPVINMIEPTMASRGINFEFNRKLLERRDVEIYVDTQKTQQMLMNLLNNACKFTPEGGRVSLRFRNIELDEEARRSEDEIIVEDSGCGMSGEFIERAFMPFERERRPGFEGIPGTGLGLTIARGIARQSGGDISVKSEQGKGSVFTVRQRYSYRPAAERAAAEEEDFSALRGRRLLLVEDNELNAIIASKILEKEGMIVEMAENGKLAVERFAASPEGSCEFILMDIRMPEMDGLEATRLIRAMEREDARSVPIVAMSANAYEEDRLKSIEAGMNDHLSKPVEPKLLYQTILKYIGKKDRAEP